MPRQGPVEVDVLGGGMEVKTPSKGVWLQNLLLFNNAWEVRPGFGQLTQRDTTLSQRDTRNTEQGLVDHLGSYAMVTDQGHTQVISVYRTRASSSSIAGKGEWLECTTVQIHDVTANTHWEEPLFRHTSENNIEVNPLSTWRGHYETSRDENTESWVGASEHQVGFAEWNDHLIFGSREIGLWAYTPCDFLTGRSRHRQTDGVNSNIWMPPYAESSCVIRIAPVDGVHELKAVYMSSSEFPSFPSAIVEFNGTLAIAQQRDVFFSDVENPCSIIDVNVITIPSEEQITAMGVAGDALLIFTKNETFHYIANVGLVISKGRLSQISRGVGCLSQSALCKVESAVVWVDKNGVYSNGGGLQVENISENIEPFFLDDISNPLTHYFVRSGFTSLVNEQPRMTYRLDPKDVSCVYDSVRSYVHIAIPVLNAILSFHTSSGFWSIQILESTVAGTVATPTPSVIGVQQQLTNPWLTEADDRIFLTAGVESHTLDDDAIGGDSRAALNRDTVSNSYILCELGRGGALDRSVDEREDNRIFAGQYTKFDNSGTPTGQFYIEKPILCPDNYVLPGGIAGVAGYPDGRSLNNIILAPVYLTPDTSANSDIDQLVLVFKYDNTNWRVVTRATNSAIIDVVFPPERQGSAEGWGVGNLGPVALSAEMQVYNSGTGLVDPVGDEIRLYFDAGVGTIRSAWAYTVMNATKHNKNILFYLPFEILNPTTTSMSSYGMDFEHSFQVSNEPAAYDLDVYIWDHVTADDKHGDDDVAQPVDWCFKSDQIGLDGSNRIMARGLITRLISHGQSTLPIFPNHDWGLFNTLIGCDWKDWVSQIVDYTGIDPTNIPGVNTIAKKQSIRTRIRTGSPATMNLKTYNNVATWGEDSDSTDGNYLIDNQQLDTIVTSDAVKGETVSFMLFGFIRGRAERIVLDNVKASLRTLQGGRRREGR